MTSKTTSPAASAKTTKQAAAKRRKQSGPTNVERNAAGQSEPRAGVGTKKQKEPFVL